MQKIKLFTCGPVQLYPDVANIRNSNCIYFRTKEYGDMVLNILDNISKLLGNSCKNSLIYLACSGTGAMEATIENCVFDFDRSLVINGGGFGKRFCELLSYHNKEYISLDLKWNENLTSEHLTKYEDAGITTLFVNIHETTCGKLYDLKLISEFCRKNNILLIVDAISSFLADDYDMNKYGVDVTIISSQKGLCCSPGCSFVSFSQKMLDKLSSKKLSSSKYFNFNDYLVNILRGQTPYTPPVFVMYEIQEMIKLINSVGGKEVWINSVKDRANYFRTKIQKLDLKIPSYNLSNMLTPICFENSNAYKIFLKLSEYGIYVNPCGGELSNIMLRVSHIGNISKTDIDVLCDKLLYSLKEVRGNL